MKLTKKKDDRPWREFTPQEIYSIVCRDCVCCKYSLGTPDDQNIYAVSCDYMRMENQRRPCRPGQCRRCGVFREKVKDNQSFW